MDIKAFSTIAESLRQYRRADSRDYEGRVENPIETLYVDPLAGDAVLNTVLSPNTTYLVGRKGTGKSTVFARAQSEIRKSKDLLSVYVDVKALYDLITGNDTPVKLIDEEQVSESMLRSHLLRKHFLSSVVSDIIHEVEKASQALNLFKRWTGQKGKYEEALAALRSLAVRIKTVELTAEEIPILRVMTAKTRDREQNTERHQKAASAGGSVSPLHAAANARIGLDDLEEALSDQEVYSEYSDAVLRSFPFASLLEEIRNLIENVGIKRLIVFLDDFSELAWVDQHLFVDVVLSPLNNASMEAVKLKIAAYPGRIYYGRIDPSKVDTLYLDFAVLYKSADIQTAEQSAVDYTTRLLTARFGAFGQEIESYLRHLGRASG